MSGEQWFQLWLAVIQVSVGAIVTVGAVFVAARLALGQQYRRAIEDRSRTAAEKLFFSLTDSWKHLSMLHGTIEFVIQPRPTSVSELSNHNVDLVKIAEKASSQVDAIKLETSFISDAILQERIRWALLSLTDFQLVTMAQRNTPDRFTLDDVSKVAAGAADCLGQVCSSINQYLRGASLFPMAKPTHWLSPVDQV